MQKFLIIKICKSFGFVKNLDFMNLQKFWFWRIYKIFYKIIILNKLQKFLIIRICKNFNFKKIFKNYDFEKFFIKNVQKFWIIKKEKFSNYKKYVKVLILWVAKISILRN